jgi:flagellar biosynthesis protein FlhA
MLQVITLDPRLDRKLTEQLSNGGAQGYWLMDPALSQRLVASFRQAAERMAMHGQQPVICCSPALRRYIHRLTERPLPAVPVLSLNEIDAGAKIKAAETIRIDVE